MLINTPEKMERRKRELLNQKIESLFRAYYKNPKKGWVLLELQRLTGLGDYIPGQDDGEPPAENNHE